MFKREIKFIYDFNLNKLKRLGAYFTLDQLMDSDLHPAILQYISAEIDYLIFEDKQQLLKNSAFDYSSEKIGDYFNLIGGEIKKTKRFSIEYISKLILHAVSFNINYLVRPRWAMLKFLFDDEKHKTSGEIKQILNYIYFYDFQKKILVSYLNQKKLLSINYNELEELLVKIDNLGKESYQRSIIQSALNSMADFFSIGGVSKSNIPLEAVNLFLKEKGYQKHLDALEDSFGSSEKQKYDIDDLYKILNTVDSFPGEMETVIADDDIWNDAEELKSEDIPNAFKHPEKTEVQKEEDFFKVTEEQAEEINKALNSIDNIDPALEEEKVDAELPPETVDQTEIPNAADEVELDSPEISETETGDEDQIAEEAQAEWDVQETEKHEMATELDSILEEIEKEDVKTMIDESAEVEREYQVTPSSDDSPGVGLDEELFGDDQNIPDSEQKDTDLVSEAVEELALDDSDLTELSDFTEPPAVDELALDEEKYEALETGAEETETESDEIENLTQPDQSSDEFWSEDKTDIAEEEEGKGGEEIHEEPDDELEPIYGEGDEEIFDEEEVSLNGEFTDSDLEVESDSSIEEEKAIPLVDEATDLSDDEFEEGGSEYPSSESEETGISDDESSSPDLETEDEMIQKNEEEIPTDLPLEEKSASKNRIEISELLEHKNMTKIIEVVFDYDMEDFANAIESISEAGSLEEALEVCHGIFKNNHIDPNSKEAENLKAIIAEFLTDE